jgi:hypothetical protein
MDTGHWLINEDVYIFENMFGFIYEITNKVNGKNISVRNSAQESQAQTS